VPTLLRTSLCRFREYERSELSENPDPNVLEDNFSELFNRLAMTKGIVLIEDSETLANLALIRAGFGEEQ
jgi:hypothetical protein